MSDIAALTSTATALGGGSTSDSKASLSKLTEDLDNFLTLLTAQLQHQDPLEPLDTHEFTNQLVQFSSVEQSIQQNKNLESIIELNQNNMAISAVSYIGKEVSATGQKNMLANGKATFSLPYPKPPRREQYLLPTKPVMWFSLVKQKKLRVPMNSFGMAIPPAVLHNQTVNIKLM